MDLPTSTAERKKLARRTTDYETAYKLAQDGARTVRQSLVQNPICDKNLELFEVALTTPFPESKYAFERQYRYVAASIKYRKKPLPEKVIEMWANSADIRLHYAASILS